MPISARKSSKWPDFDTELILASDPTDNAKFIQVMSVNVAKSRQLDPRPLLDAAWTLGRYWRMGTCFRAMNMHECETGML